LPLYRVEPRLRDLECRVGVLSGQYKLLEKRTVEKVPVGERFQRPAHPHVAVGILLGQVQGGARPDHPAIDSP